MGKDCGYHSSDEEDGKSSSGGGGGGGGIASLILIIIGVLIFLTLFVILLIYLILRPTKPTFILQDATVYSFNASTQSPATLLSTTFQVTLRSRNPNARIAVYYDKLAISASYRSQQITLSTYLPPTYQGHKDVVSWSPFIYGSDVPVSPLLSESMVQDQVAGLVLVNVKVSGIVKWKVGTWVSGKYRLFVTCPAYLTFGDKKGNAVVVFGPAIKYQLATGCHVDV